MSSLRLDTRLILGGEPEPRRSATMAVDRSTVHASRGGTGYKDLVYPRLSNLGAHRVLADKLVAVEGTEAALVTGSGMAAISSALLTVVSAEGPGGHVLVQDCLYGGTQALLDKEMRAYGMTYSVLPMDDPDAWPALVQPNTRGVYVEAITNPTCQVIDHERVVAFAQAHGLVSLIDNTFASPVNFRPVEHGYDLSLHSATKYLNGHSDVVAGAVLGSTAWVDRIHETVNHLGGSLDPDSCYLLYRGLRTLALRVRCQSENAMQLARFLEDHPSVVRVHYPGLSSHPHHVRAAKWFDGFGGMLAFELDGGMPRADRFLDAVQLAIVGPSLGGVETLLTQPARTTHQGQTPEERARMGISDGLIRMSVGVEAVEDLIHDLSEALAH